MEVREGARKRSRDRMRNSMEWATIVRYLVLLDLSLSCRTAKPSFYAMARDRDSIHPESLPSG